MGVVGAAAGDSASFGSGESRPSKGQPRWRHSAQQISSGRMAWLWHGVFALLHTQPFPSARIRIPHRCAECTPEQFWKERQAPAKLPDRLALEYTGYIRITLNHPFSLPPPSCHAPPTLPNLAHSPSFSPPSWRGSSADSTPISTPVAADYSYPHQAKSRSWDQPHAHRRPPVDDSLTSDDFLFPHDDDDDEPSLPLFPAASPPPSAFGMSGTASPIDIATARQTSTSPRNQQSNLTSQLQRPAIDVKREDVDDEPPEDIAPLQKPRQESISMLGTTPHGARTIPGRDGMRRESTTNLYSNSLMGGMSWGGISMNNFLHDDIMMAGTSPYGFQSPSFHSSSYLPKMEANYMKDYVCCDIKLDSMHELLQHYEEAHAAQPNQTIGRTPKELQFPSTRAANAASTAQAVQQQAQAQQANLANQLGSTQNATNPSPLFSGQSAEQMGTFDNLDTMDMDDTMLSQPNLQQGVQFQPQPNFGRQQPRGAGVNVNLAAAFQGQGLNSNGTTTPHANHQVFQNNPTVSSVNTPNLNSQSSMSQQALTPDSSIPNSPAPALPHNLDYTNQLDLNSLDYAQLMQGNTDFNTLSLNNTNNLNGGSTGTIDDPAKRLLSKQGYANHSRFGNAQNSNANSNNSELAKRLREQQLLNGLAGAGGFVGEEIKPFKCPVIGCEKAYKNQNGLKYHKQHGHQNQQLKENPDGTFSIVDPTTSIPYPGTVGMEKEKPYRCEVCGKRYKNLNGLKYHRQHSPPCNPDLVKPNAGLVQGGLQGMGVNVAGAGLLGMNDGMGY